MFVRATPWLSALPVSGLALLVALAGMPLLASAQQPDDSIRAKALRDFHGPDLQGKDGPLAKAGLDLLLIYHKHQSNQEEGAGGPTIQSEREQDTGNRASEIEGVRMSNGRVAIDAIASGPTDTLRTALEELGLKDAASAGQIVSGRFPIDRIPALAKLESLQSASPSRMQTRTESTQGDRADAIRSSEASPSDTAGAGEQSPPSGDASQPSSADTTSTAVDGDTDDAEDDMLGPGVLIGALAVLAGLLGFLFWR